jgi:hypothetical protein
MSDFNPGPEWVAVDIRDENTAVYELAQYGDDGQLVGAWVREAPLPTEPYTFILVTWKDGGHSVLTLVDGEWCANANITKGHTPHQLAKQITGFEVLSEPRAVTAKAVLDRLFEAMQGNGMVPGRALTEASREFGVES